VCWEKLEIEAWAILCCVLGEVRNWAVGDRVLCAERGKKFSSGRYRTVCWERCETERWAINFFWWCKGGIERWAIQFFVLREVRNRVVGDKVLCSEWGGKLNFGRYSDVLRQGEIERWAIQCWELRERRNWAVGVIVLCAARGEKFSGGRYVMKGKYYLRWRRLQRMWRL